MQCDTGKRHKSTPYILYMYWYVLDIQCIYIIVVVIYAELLSTFTFLVPALKTVAVLPLENISQFPDFLENNKSLQDNFCVLLIYDFSQSSLITQIYNITVYHYLYSHFITMYHSTICIYSAISFLHS